MVPRPRNDVDFRVGTAMTHSPHNDFVSTYFHSRGNPGSRAAVAHLDARSVEESGVQAAPPSSLLGFPGVEVCGYEIVLWGVGHRRTDTGNLHHFSAVGPPPACALFYDRRKTESVAYPGNFRRKPKNPLSRAVNDRTGMKLVAASSTQERSSLYTRGLI